MGDKFVVFAGTAITDLHFRKDYNDFWYIKVIETEVICFSKIQKAVSVNKGKI